MNRGHFSGRAAGPTDAPSPVGQLQDVAVGVALKKDEGAFAGAVVGLVPLRRQDPIPAELVKVDGEFVAAAALLLALTFLAVHSDHPLSPVLAQRLRLYLNN